jgi:hypothetical protein
VEPGIVSTDLAKSLAAGPDTSIYPQAHRFAALYRASLKTPNEPEIVGDKIRNIVESDSWQFRYPVGPDAKPFMDWRAAMTDEDWIDWGAANDEEWYAAVERDFGIDARSEL